MVGPEDAADAVRLQHELYKGSDGLGCGHATMVVPDASRRIGDIPEPNPRS